MDLHRTEINFKDRLQVARTPLPGRRSSFIAGLGLLFAVTLTTLSQPLHGQNFPQRIQDLKSFEGQYGKLRNGFVTEIHKLIQEREQSGDRPAVDELRQIEKPIDHDTLRGRKLPEKVQPELPEEMKAEERAWRTRVRSLQSEHATKLYQLARQAAQKRLASFAFDLLHEALFHDPDHAGARKVFGYQLIDDLWLTSFAATKRKEKYEWSDRFGWLPAEYVARYENGERYFQGRWMTAEKEQQVRSNFRYAWLIRTEHFEVRTNYSLESGVALAKDLEEFNRAFFATFAGSFTPRDEWNQLLNGGSAGTTVEKPHRVYYYRTREEYLKTCQPKMPVNIGITLGLYIPGDRISYFYHPEDPEADVRRTVFHEATHQLFSETRPSRQPIAVNGDFWAVEGIACYMESFKPSEEGYSLGDPAYIRFQNARDRRLGRVDLKPYYRPLAEFTRLGHIAYQRDPEQRANYSQGSGLAHFFMHYQDGLYRDGFIEYLSDIYSPASRTRAQPRSLQELTEVPFSDLDRQYGDYMRKQAEQVRVMAPDVPAAFELDDVSGVDATDEEPISDEAGK